MARRIQSVNDVIDQARRSMRTGGQFVFPEDLGAHGILLVFRKYRYHPPGTRGFVSDTAISNIQSSILLPLPANIADSYSMRIGRPELGIVNESVATGAASAANGGNSNVIESAWKNLESGAITSQQAKDLVNGSGTDIASNAAQNIKFLMRSALPGGISTAIDQGMGAAINPKMSLSFDGLDLKTHTFDWNLMVRSPNESDILRDISTEIKRNIHPSYLSAGGFQRAMLQYPSTVDVFFVGIDENYFYRFKTCMVQSFNMNFSPNGPSILKGGKPAGAQMSIQLIETDIHTAEDYGGEGGGSISSEITNSFNEFGETTNIPRRAGDR